MTTSKSDYYELLGISRQASADEIKRAFRRQALKYHPDRNKEAGADARFKRINEANHIISNSKTRDIYDRYGEAGLKSQMGGMDIDLSSFGDFFGGLFNTRRSTRDLSYEVTLELGDVLKPTEHEINYDGLVVCPHCDGQRSAPGTRPRTCSACGGTGSVISARRAFFIEFKQSRPCTDCRASGVIIETPCPECGAVGKVKSQRKLKFEIPAGVEDGTVLRVRGQGEPGIGGEPHGDLYVSVGVNPDRRFERHATHLLAPLKLNFAQAALGGEHMVPTLEGEHKLKVPAGVQNGSELRIKGIGLPHTGNPYKRGDLIMVVQIASPRELSKRQQQLFEELRKTFE